MFHVLHIRWQAGNCEFHPGCIMMHLQMADAMCRVYMVMILANASPDLLLMCRHLSQNVCMHTGIILRQFCTQHLACNPAGDALPCWLSIFERSKIALSECSHSSESRKKIAMHANRCANRLRLMHSSAHVACCVSIFGVHCILHMHSVCMHMCLRAHRPSAQVQST